MFNMSDLLIELWATEKLYTFPFKYTSLDSIALSPPDILWRKIGKLTLLLSILNLKIYFPLTKK